MDHIDPGMAGHSGRRSGAMWYARSGLAIHEIGTLVRWKSSAVFRYIEEALRGVPLNSNLVRSKSTPNPGVAPSTPMIGGQPGEIKFPVAPLAR